VGLSSESPRLDAGTYSPSKTQRWLMSNWNDFKERISIKRRAGNKIVTVVNGDAVDLNKYDTYQLITTNRYDVVQHGFELLHPIQNLSDDLYLGRGTAAHTGEAAELETMLARLLNLGQDQHYWSLQLSIYDNLFQFEHFGKIGSTPWTLSNPVVKLGYELYLNRVSRNLVPYKIAFRSHAHIHVDTTDLAPTRVIQTPCWQAKTDWSQGKGFITDPTIGGILVDCYEDGSYTVETVLYPLPAQDVIYVS
jgi:hypothetical protein